MPRSRQVTFTIRVPLSWRALVDRQLQAASRRAYIAEATDIREAVGLSGWHGGNPVFAPAKPEPIWRRLRR